MKLDEIDVLQLQSRHMKTDPTTVAMAAAVQPALRDIAVSIPLILLYARIDPAAGSGIEPLSEDLLDELAWGFGIDFYDVGADVDRKRQLVRSAIRIHRMKGTPAAVEEAMTIAFSAATLEEWFEYGGAPYTFRITTDARISSIADLDRFLKALRAAKRASTQLTEIIVNGTASISQHARVELMTSPLYELSVDPLTMTWAQWDAQNRAWTARDASGLTFGSYFKIAT